MSSQTGNASQQTLYQIKKAASAATQHVQRQANARNLCAPYHNKQAATHAHTYWSMQRISSSILL
jgi:hypothetical protein